MLCPRSTYSSFILEGLGITGSGRVAHRPLRCPEPSLARAQPDRAVP